MMNNGKAYGLYIDGRFQPASTGRVIRVENPKDGSHLADVAEGDDEDIDLAIDAAERAAAIWAATPGAVRGDIMHRAGELLAKKLPDLVSIEVDQIGRARREMSAQLGRLPEWFRYFGALARTHEDTVPSFGGNFLNYTRRVPLGVVGHVTPWNHPLLILTKKIAPSMAAGNTMVVKPSELAPITPLLLGDIFKEAGVPDGVYNVVPGYGATAGKALTTSKRIKKIDLTGGTETGKMVASLAGANLTKVSAELGGKAAVIVFDDTPIERGVAAALFASFIASGGKRFTWPGKTASPGVSPSSLRSNSICRPMQMPRKGLERAASSTAGRNPLASSSRMQSGIAPCPGNTTRSARPTDSGSEVTATVASGATCSSALETERRLPMP